MLKNNLKKLVLAVMLPAMLVGCANTTKDEGSNGAKEDTKEINISIAASLVNPMDEIIKAYKDKNNVKVNVNSGGSGALEKQIEEGADVDLFISASTSNIDTLEEKDMIEKDTRYDILKNDLVLIVSKDNEELLNEIKNKSVDEIFDYINGLDDKLALGTPETVPAGAYGEEALKNLGIYDYVKDKIVNTKDVTQVLTYVENKDAVAGIVYGSDAISSSDVKVAYTFSDNSHSDIVYTGAVIKDSKNSDDAKKFFDYLKEDKSKQVFKKYGFK